MQQAVVELLRRDKLYTGAFFFGMDEANMLRFLECPWVMIGSDASLRSTSGPLSQDHPHPRAYGSFARLLRMALDGKSIPLSEMIRRMTSLPAESFRLKGRGRIVVGAAADICVFDPAQICDRATYEAPHAFSSGVRHLFVNGKQAVCDGELTDNRSGSVLG